MTGKGLVPATSFVADEYITGYLISRATHCDRCAAATRCIYIESVEMPQGVNVESTILWSPLGHLIGKIGIGCGCYSKFHRQITHIREKMKG